MLGQLVYDDRTCRWVKATSAEQVGGLHGLQPRRQDVGWDRHQSVGEVAITPRACQQVADDQECPALARDVERVSQRAVLVIGAGHLLEIARAACWKQDRTTSR